MIAPTIKIDGVEVEYPANFTELSVNVNFDSDESTNSLFRTVESNINEWEFTKEHKAILNEWREKYFFEGLPMTIDTIGEGKIEDLLTFLLAVKDANPISCDKETVPALEIIDQLKGNRDFTFEYLYEGAKYPHPNFTFVPVPYCKNAPNDAEIFLAFISAVLFIIELQSVLEDLIDKIANCSSWEWGEWIASIPFFIRLFVVAVAGLQTMQMLYNLLVQPVKFHAGMKLVDIFTVGYSFIGYDFKSTIFETEPFNKVVMLPAKFQVPNNEEVQNNLLVDILGIDLSVLKGFTSPDPTEQTAFSTKTFGEIVDSFKESMNLKEVIEAPQTPGQNPVVRLERIDYGTTAQTVQLDPIEIREFTYNSNDFAANTTILFLLDNSDINTLNYYLGTSFTEAIYPTEYKNKRNLLINGYKKVQIPYARGIRKTGLNKIEKILNRLFKEAAPIMNDFVFQHNVKLKQAITVATTIVDIINDVINQANTIPGISINNVQLPNSGPFQDVPYLTVPNFETLIGNRVGMLLLEEDTFSIDKLIVVDEKYSLLNNSDAEPSYLLGEYFFDLFNEDNIETLQGIVPSGGNPAQNVLSPENKNVISAEYFWKKFHSINSFVPNVEGETDWVNGKHGQYILYDTAQFTLCPEDYRKLLETNKMEWCEKQGEFFDELKWNPFTRVAEGKFKINQIFYRNLRSEKIIANGSTRTKKFKD